MNMVSLFTGIGGFDLAASVLGWNILFQSEINPFCTALLKGLFPYVPNLGNIYDINATAYRNTVDVLVGGFPCQPFSNAGLQKGESDPRFLWPQMFRIIRECKPRWIVAENVYGLISHANGVVFEQVCANLESEGYEVQTYIIPAAGKDSFQERKRVWIVASLNGQRSEAHEATPGEHFKAFRKTKNQLPDCTHFESWMESIQHYSQLDGVVYGIPNWMDRTHALGNAIDPRIAYDFLITIEYLSNV